MAKLATRCFLALIVALLLTQIPGSAMAEISGPAKVIDGDTITIGGIKIRLHGIDAPENAQICRRDHEIWRCGQQAALALAEKVGQRPVSCEERGRDRYGRIVAVCTADGEDLNAWLVSEGLALAYRRYSNDYVGQERAARDTKRGLWRGEFVAPWQWRKGKRMAGEKTADAAFSRCRIKGNISRKGKKIYHLPNGRYYAATKIDEGRGEQWFCSEREAKGAGWRRSSQ